MFGRIAGPARARASGAVDDRVGRPHRALHRSGPVGLLSLPRMPSFTAQAARRSYRWCSPPTSGNATTSPSSRSCTAKSAKLNGKGGADERNRTADLLITSWSRGISTTVYRCPLTYAGQGLRAFRNSTVDRQRPSLSAPAATPLLSNGGCAATNTGSGLPRGAGQERLEEGPHRLRAPAGTAEGPIGWSRRRPGTQS